MFAELKMTSNVREDDLVEVFIHDETQTQAERDEEFFSKIIFMIIEFLKYYVFIDVLF
jgi:hypothetical protein